MLGSVATLFAQFVAGYTGSNTERRGRNIEQQAVWSLLELQELLDEWIVAAWANRPHDGLRDPAHPRRMFSPNEKYAAMVEAAGYVPVALSADDYIELLPARWQAVNSYGIKINHRIYDSEELNPFRRQPSGVVSRKDLWEIHHDPYDVSRIWVRDHWNGDKWITLFWKQLHRVAAPFGELAWDHTRRALPEATEEELADAVSDLLKRAHDGSSSGKSDAPGRSGRRDRRVAARTKASPPSIPITAEPAPAAADSDPNEDGGQDLDAEQDNIAKVIPMPIFDPFTEADKRW